MKLVVSGPAGKPGTSRKSSTHTGGEFDPRKVLLIKVTIRPVLVKRKRVLSFSYLTATQDVTKNYAGDEAASRLEEVLALPFTRYHLQSRDGDLHVKLSRKGKPLITRGAPSSPVPERQSVPLPDSAVDEIAASEPLALAHDRVKKYPLPADRPDSYLQAIGVMSPEGRVYADHQAKYRQVNEFLRLLEPYLPQGEKKAPPLFLVDCGCGNSYLTFAAYHYIKEIKGLSLRMVGVDRNPDLVTRNRELAGRLGWDALDFVLTAIADYSPVTSPDLVLCLHACDTATDEALARGVAWQSRVLLAAPCCQHDLQTKLEAPPLFAPVMRHGILRERMGDLLTDAFRALALRIAGYRTEVIQFVSPEHTAKNLMIRAERGGAAGEAAPVAEYRELKKFWNVVPAIETWLGPSFQRLVA